MRLFFALLLGLAACGGSAEDTCDIQAAPAEGAAPPTFAQVQTSVFRACGFSSCHAFKGATAKPKGQAVITSRSADADRVYADLVNAPAATIKGRDKANVPTRVVPGDPLHSFLIWKVVGHDPR